MSSGSNERATENEGLLPTVSETVDASTVVVFLGSVVAGYSISLFGTDAVALPVVGTVSGPLLGALGLAAFAVAYRRFGRCGGSGNCGCSSDCGDSCSRDP